MNHPDYKSNPKQTERTSLVRRNEIASILASAIVRKHLRDVRNLLKKNGKIEKVLAVSFGKSVHPLEPEHEGERH